MSRPLIGRVLCLALGFLYAAGAVSLFSFGATAEATWSQWTEMLATTLGVPNWIATVILGFFSVGGPLGLVWVISGNQVNRSLWFLAGLMSYGVSWLSGWPAMLHA